MTDRLDVHNRLRDLRSERRLTLDQLSQKVDIPKATLGSCESIEDKNVSHTMLIKLADFYGVSVDYLLGLTETREPQNVEITELRLDDATLNLLRGDRLNHRLLCELITHPAFEQFLTDCEIYVNGIAAEPIKNMNLWIDTVRSQMMQRSRPEDDIYIQALEKAHVDENEYFCHITHGDLNAILQDLRRAHENDRETSLITEKQSRTQKTIDKFIQEAKYKSNPIEGFWRIMSETLHINFDKIPKDMAETMKAYLKLSPFSKQLVPKHKKK